MCVCTCVFVCMYEVQKRAYDVRFAVSDTFGNVHDVRHLRTVYAKWRILYAGYVNVYAM